MRAIIITQNEPFYLLDNLKYLLNSMPKEVSIIGFILSPPSTFGKKESFLKRILNTVKIFGIKFFIYYSFKYIKNLFLSENIINFFQRRKIKQINLYSSINDKESIETIKKYKPDLIISILGSEIFKKKIINLPTYGIINLHSSLLPKYRGLMPSFWVLKNNELSTGVSVFFVNDGIDSGPIISQEKFQIKNLTHRELIIHSKKLGMKLIIKSIKKILSNDLQLIENNDFDMSYYSFPERKDVIDFFKKGKKFF